jgi:hypothetical protein
MKFPWKFVQFGWYVQTTSFGAFFILERRIDSGPLFLYAVSMAAVPFLALLFVSTVNLVSKAVQDDS